MKNNKNEKKLTKKIEFTNEEMIEFCKGGVTSAENRIMILNEEWYGDFSFCYICLVADDIAEKRNVFFKGKHCCDFCILNCSTNKEEWWLKIFKPLLSRRCVTSVEWKIPLLDSLMDRKKYWEDELKKHEGMEGK